MQGLQEALEDAQGKLQLKRDVLSTEDTRVETRGQEEQNENQVANAESEED
jgi:hypothetical protein